MLSLVTKGMVGPGLPLATKGVLTWLWLVEEVVFVPGYPERLPRQFIPPARFTGDEVWYREFAHARHLTGQTPDIVLPQDLPAQVLPRIKAMGNETWLANFKTARSRIRR